MADANQDSRSIRRLEDSRFLTGCGRYVEDIAEPAALHGYVLRSPHAHAVIRSLDTSSAVSMPGVRLIATADDLAADGLGFMPCLAAVKPMIVPPRPALASGRVRHVGDPVCFVVADSAEMAREAAERIEIDYEPLPSVIHGRTALADGAPALWDEAPGNLVYHVQRGDHAAVAEAMKGAAHIVEVDVTNNRVIVVPLEPRAGIARYDTATDTMDLELTGQGLHGIRRQLAEFIFKVAPERIQLHAPDVGGGFGMKNFLYPEWILLLWAARKLKRPVRWLADRAEDFVMGAQGRDIEATARIALDDTGRILALDLAMVANLGAYLSGNGPGASVVAASTAQGGVYDIPAIAVDVRGALTNTTPVDAYRGAGKPEANYIVERAIEAAARALGRDPADLRRQNLIASFPYKTAMGMAIDSGDFVANLDAAVARAPGFEARRAVPLQAVQVFPHRMDADVAGNSADTAAHHHRRDVDVAPLQPLGAADIVGIGPRPRDGGGIGIPRQRPVDDDLLAELIEYEGTGERLVGRECGDDVGFVALGVAGEIEAQPAGPGRADRLTADIAGCVQLPAEFAQLFFEDGHGEPARGLDRSQRPVFRQRLHARTRQLAQDLAQHRQIGRAGERLCRRLEFGERA